MWTNAGKWSAYIFWQVHVGRIVLDITNKTLTANAPGYYWDDLYHSLDIDLGPWTGVAHMPESSTSLIAIVVLAFFSMILAWLVDCWSPGTPAPFPVTHRFRRYPRYPSRLLVFPFPLLLGYSS